MKGILIRVVIVLIIGGILWYWYELPNNSKVDSDDILTISNKNDFSKKESENKSEKKIEFNAKKNEEEKKEDLDILKQKKQKFITVLQEDIKNNVPFISQAPKSQWRDKKFQDACEEASILMAHRWRSGEGKMSKNKATKELEKMFEQEIIFFNEEVLDTSIDDTARFAREYFGGKFEVMNSDMSAIYTALYNGSIVIIPTNGKKLNNPNFSNGGPERHMLVITGYDESKKEFITNDPGTKKGEDYRYPRSRLYNAIRDYKTGHKEHIDSIDKKMIVVER